MLTNIEILEHSALAWPNPRAFATTPRPARVASRFGGREAHAHSSAAPKALQMVEDPFVGGMPAPQWRLRARATKTDETMPDVTGSRREPSEMSIETSSMLDGARTTRSTSLAKRKRAVSEGGSDMMGVGGLQGFRLG